MALYGQYDWRSRAKGTSLTSLALLAVFVGAAALMLALVIWRPGLGGGDPAAPVAGGAGVPAAEAQPADAAAGAAPAAEAPGPDSEAGAPGQ